MKKIATYCLAVLSIGLQAQSTIAVYRLNPNTGAVTTTLTNGYNLMLNTDTNTIEEEQIKIKNTSAVTHTYDMSRSFVVQLPTLYTTTQTPNSYFCFGFNCFASNVSVANSSNYTVLTPGEDSETSGNPTSFYLSEAATKGVYTVHYKIFNVDPNFPNDTSSFNAVYNSQSVGIKTIENKIDLVSELYPNPNSNGSPISFDLVSDQDLKFQIYNSLGGLVYVSGSQKYSAGKNKLGLDGAGLSNGMYLVTITSASGTTTKRLVINK